MGERTGDKMQYKDIINIVANAGLVAAIGAIGARRRYLQKAIVQYENELEDFKSLRGLLREFIAISPQYQCNKYDRMLTYSFMIYKLIADSELCKHDEEVMRHYNHWIHYVQDIEADISRGGCTISHHWEAFVMSIATITPKIIIPIYEDCIQKFTQEYGYLSEVMSMLTALIQGIIGLIP